jgi:putative Mn2+ efflux pump MntP
VNQTRIESFFEAITHAVFGAATGLLAQLVVFPAVGVRVRMSQNLVILAAFTGISIARTYVVRRFFVSYFHRFAAWLAGLVAAWLERIARWLK